MQGELQGASFQLTYPGISCFITRTIFLNGVGEEGPSAFAQEVKEFLEGLLCRLLTEEVGRVEESSLQTPACRPNIGSGLKKPSAGSFLTGGSFHRGEPFYLHRLREGVPVRL